MFTMITIILIIYWSKNNIITLYIGIEILLLIITIKIIYISGDYDDINGTITAIYIIILAGIESTIGLSLLVSYYRLRGKVSNQL